MKDENKKWQVSDTFKYIKQEMQISIDVDLENFSFD
jgi:hypothetical protein